MGGLDSIFGGGYSAPSAPEPVAAPAREAEVEPVAESVRKDEQRKLRARRGMSGTILTSPLGTGGSGGILGRLGQG